MGRFGMIRVDGCMSPVMASGYHFWLPLGPAMLRRDLFQRSETSWWPPAKGLFCDNIPVNLGNYRMKIYETGWISMDDDGVGMARSSRFLPLEIPILWSDSTGCSIPGIGSLTRWDLMASATKLWFRAAPERSCGTARPRNMPRFGWSPGLPGGSQGHLRDFEGIDLDFLAGFMGCCYCCYTWKPAAVFASLVSLNLFSKAISSITPGIFQPGHSHGFSWDRIISPAWKLLRFVGHLNNFEGPVFDSSSLRGARRPAKKEMLELTIPGYSRMGCWENFLVEPPITSQIYQIRNLGFSVEKLWKTRMSVFVGLRSP